jgi:hypothetical protein
MKTLHIYIHVGNITFKIKINFDGLTVIDGDHQYQVGFD